MSGSTTTAPAPEAVRKDVETSFVQRHRTGLAVGVPGLFFLIWRFIAGEEGFPGWLVRPGRLLGLDSEIPEGAVFPLLRWINTWSDWLAKTELIGTWTFKDFTRWVSDLLDYPLDFLESLLSSGFRTFPFMSDGLPPMPWVMIVGLFTILGWYLGGRRLALLSAASLSYMALFGLWELSMITLSVVVVVVPVSVFIGWAVGVLAIKKPKFENFLMPGLNLLQAMPHFAYLVPIAVFIGLSHKAGVIATMIFAFPPMARLTILGMKGIPDEIIEAGRMAGCTNRQMLWKVELPAARPSILIGINQVIMQTLAMVMIAAFIGTGGLGLGLLINFIGSRIGQALEIGVAIVLMAIMFDRLSQAMVGKQPERKIVGPFWKVHPYLSWAGLIVVLSTIAYLFVDSAGSLPNVPDEPIVTTAQLWNDGVSWMQVTLFEPLKVFRRISFEYYFKPLKTVLTALPWVAAVLAVGTIGWYLGKWRYALIPSLYIAFIAFSGFWPQATHTLYLLVASLILCIAVGVPLGIWASAKDWRFKTTNVMLDTFQTMPSFIYLLPVIMLFSIGDLAVVTAVFVYSMIPIARFTLFGLRNVRHDLIEAGLISGCTERQLLWKVRMPLAFPQIMLGLNQTINFALFMVMIAAFITPSGLGGEIFLAKTWLDTGKGIVVGLCIAMIGMASDVLITRWARDREDVLGIA